MSVFIRRAMALGALALVWIPSLGAQATSWPPAERIFQVEVAVFTYPTPARSPMAQVGRTSFPQATALAGSPLDGWTTLLRHRPTPPKPLSEWLAWVESSALTQAAKPLVGPTLPPLNDLALLNYPLLLRQLSPPPGLLARAIERINNSPNHQLWAYGSWYQGVERGVDSPVIRVEPETTQSFWSSVMDMTWIDDAQERPAIVATVAINQRQFMHARIDAVWHQVQTNTFGPLKLAHLHPNGYSIYRLQGARLIELNRWEYFDSEAIGLLLRVSPYLDAP